MSDGEQTDKTNSISEILDQNLTSTDLEEVNIHGIPDDQLTPDQRIRKLGHRIINMTATLSIMVDTVTKMADSSSSLAHSTHELAKKIGDVEDKRRRDRIVFLFCTVLLLTVMVIGGVVVSSVRDVAKGNGEQLAILRSATGPEAQAKQAEQTAKIVDLLDCRNQEALRNIISGMHFPGVSVPPRTVVCQQVLGANP